MTLLSSWSKSTFRRESARADLQNVDIDEINPARHADGLGAVLVGSVGSRTTSGS